MIEGTTAFASTSTTNADVFDPATIDRWIGHFKTLACCRLPKTWSLHPRVAAARRERKELGSSNDLNQTTVKYDHHDSPSRFFSAGGGTA